MNQSATQTISLRRWFGFSISVLAVLVMLLVWKLPTEQYLDFSSLEGFRSSISGFMDSVRELSPVTKLLLFATYMSICCTFCPLNTSWLVAAVAMQEVAVASSMGMTVLLVATIGAAASTLANLNDYHLFTLLLRHHRVARFRETKLMHRAGPWFDRQPFALLLIFNVLPIPVDVARILAATQCYSRVRFAIANFVGRLIRYTIIAAITYQLGSEGWIAPLALLAMALVMVLAKWIASKRNKKETV